MESYSTISLFPNRSQPTLAKFSIFLENTKHRYFVTMQFKILILSVVALAPGHAVASKKTPLVYHPHLQ